jgi:LysR family nitrogen assimilation transcriptional regulator
MDLQAVRYFVAAVEAGSFAGAAAKLGLTQPAVARQVRLLERELGVPLVASITPRRLAATPSGQVLLAAAGEIGAILDRARRDALDRATEPSGPVCLALPPVAGAALVQSAIPIFLQRFPKVRVSVLSGYSGYIEDWLLKGEADLGMLFGDPRSSELETTPLLEQQLFLIVPSGAVVPAGAARLVRARSCSLAQLAGVPFVLPGAHHALRTRIDDAVAAAGLAPLSIVLEVDSFDLMKKFVSDGLGCSILGYDAVLREVDSGALRAVPLAPRIPWRLSFAERKGRYRSLAVAALEALIFENAARLLRAGAVHGRLLMGGNGDSGFGGDAGGGG